MWARCLAAVALLTFLSSQVEAHGFCTKIEIGGTTYPGFDPRSAPGKLIKSPQRPADNAHTEKADYTTAQVATGGNALSATNYEQYTAPASAGDKVIVHYDQWPQPHSGPCMIYMANCGKSCDGVKPGGLDWFKIGQEGFHDGQWPNDRLSESNDWGSQFTLPTNLPSGKYLLAHHMLALHSLGDPQFYPVAFQIDLKSSGTANPQPKGKFPDMYLNGPQDFKTWNIYEAGAGNADMKLPGIAVYKGSDTKVGNTGSNGAQDGVGGSQNDVPEPSKPTPKPTPTRNSPTKPTDLSEGWMFAQTTGTNVIKTRTKDAAPSASSGAQGGKGAPPVEEEQTEEAGDDSDDEEKTLETITDVPGKTDDREQAAAESHDCMSADIPIQGSDGRSGQPLSQDGGPVPTNIKNLATIPKATESPSGGKKQSQDDKLSDNSQNGVTVTVTVYASAPTASTITASTIGKEIALEEDESHDGVEESANEEEPTSTVDNTEGMSTDNAGGEESADAAANDSENASKFISDLPVEADCNGKVQPSARSLKPRRPEYRGDLRRVRVAKRYGSRRHDWWLK